MPNQPEVKVATVDVESGDNMATLPVSRQHGNSGAGADSAAEKNNAANKEMELKNVQPKPAQRYRNHEKNIYMILISYLYLCTHVYFYLESRVRASIMIQIKSES